MDGRFRAFSFVDRITRLEPGGRIEGHYTVPAGATAFPASLMAEAVGQLAAWSAMARLDYTRRPVAGLAGETRYHGQVTSGQTLHLTADIERPMPRLPPVTSTLLPASPESMVSPKWRNRRRRTGCGR